VLSPPRDFKKEQHNFLIYFFLVLRCHIFIWSLRSARMVCRFLAFLILLSLSRPDPDIHLGLRYIIHLWFLSDSDILFIFDFGLRLMFLFIFHLLSDLRLYFHSYCSFLSSDLRLSYLAYLSSMPSIAYVFTCLCSTWLLRYILIGLRFMLSPANHAHYQSFFICFISVTLTISPFVIGLHLV